MTLDTERRRATPEGITLSLRVAGPPARLLAWILDLVIMSVGQGLVTVVLAILGEIGQGVALIVLFSINWFYPVAFEVTRGATPGKKALGLMVVHDDGRPIGLMASLLRNLLRFADFLPVAYGAGLVSMLLSRDFQRLGDLAAGTLVVYTEPDESEIDLPSAEPVPPPVSLSREEQRALIDFGSRAKRLSQARTVELAEIAQPLTGAVGADGAQRLLGMVLWVLGRRSATP